MVGARRFGGDQHENEIDRQAVRGLEIDRPVEPGEDPEDVRAFGELAVRDGDAVADPGRAEALALQERIEDLARRKAGDLGRALAHFLQRLLLAVHPQRGHDRVRFKELR